MALIVEDGTIVEGAESYAALERADRYWDSRPHRVETAAWQASADHVKEGALRSATSYIDVTFGRDFIGYRVDLSQSLEWPKIFGIDDDDEYIVLVDPLGRELGLIPEVLVVAVIELAGQILYTGTPEGASSSDEAIKRIKVGPIDITFAETNSTSASVVAPQRSLTISDMLASILKSGTTLDPNWLWL